MQRQHSSAKSKIQKALVTLMLKKPFETITISDITLHARVNRSTYYYHYYRKEEILEEVVKKSAHDLVAAMKAPYLSGSEFLINDSVLPSTQTLFEHVHQYRYYYQALLTKEKSLNFQNEFIKILKEFLENAITNIYKGNGDSLIDQGIFTSYQAYAVLGMLKQWIEDEFQQSPQYMAEQLTNILYLKVDKVHFNFT
ncbi:TetR/AcrR family transcriptional regulator [Planomicrobium sp. CPCC 101110]|uniref:TetR/AcrR family transcriptional regulator n=1 Tax=Planomicrobium sp. CPCC 101110 TaxID=2599619 RepID=UPI0011B55AAE|nr:TetR/AcrR family transcriptional regulator [Planomicrobium sp. CPCC 101110]TWT25796.1 TetR family transcriptional regulator [Planomicrobium sp. CPCC 101110]